MMPKYLMNKDGYLGYSKDNLYFMKKFLLYSNYFYGRRTTVVNSINEKGKHTKIINLN